MLISYKNRHPTTMQHVAFLCLLQAALDFDQQSLQVLPRILRNLSLWMLTSQSYHSARFRFRQ